ncbi:MAG: HAMP domain-containing histidine kinase [Anaerolineae bacterium]|nr:HAMP domain-containing histidine kinase [Anaerolineae bacterium]
MKKFSFAILVVLVVLFLVFVVAATALLNHIPLTWQVFLVPIIAGVVGGSLLWHFVQQNRSVEKRQSEKLAVLGEQVKTLQSEQTRLEEELTQTKESTTKIIHTRTTLLNNIGHELRTPLSIILGYSDLILQNAEQQNDEQLLAFVQKIKLYTKDLSGTLNDLLQMSEIESGQVGFLLEAFGIDHVIEQAVRENQTYLDANEDELILMVAPDIGTMIADRDKVHIVLANLLNNAAKFTQSGIVTISARRTVIDDQWWIIFQVTDTGIGIPQEMQKQIFQPFLQVDDSFSKKHGGIGLGLAINRYYCELMGGRIEVESTVGEGSTFSVYLPAEVTAVASMYVRLSPSHVPPSP